MTDRSLLALWSAVLELNRKAASYATDLETTEAYRLVITHAQTCLSAAETARQPAAPKPPPAA